MKIIKTELRTWMVESICQVPECNGSMVNTGRRIQANPNTMIEHKCNRCNKVENHLKCFPRVDFEVESHKDYYPEVQHATDVINK